MSWNSSACSSNSSFSSSNGWVSISDSSLSIPLYAKNSRRNDPSRRVRNTRFDYRRSFFLWSCQSEFGSVGALRALLCVWVCADYSRCASAAESRSRSRSSNGCHQLHANTACSKPSSASMATLCARCGCSSRFLCCSTRLLRLARTFAITSPTSRSDLASSLECIEAA